MDNVNKTLYIPLYGKAAVSARGILLSDPDAEVIWGAQGLPLQGKSASKWLTYSMGIRAAVFDRWLRENLTPEAVVLHLGCGLDSRCKRVECDNPWFDADFPAVIEERKKYFPESGHYRMIGCDLREDFLREIPRDGSALVVMEGVSMYLTAGERQQLLKRLNAHFSEIRLLMDSYTLFAAKATKYKNPINDVGVTQVHGFDDPRELEEGTGFVFRQSHDMNPADLVLQLPKRDRRIYRHVFAGSFADRLYRLYEYHAPGK